MSIKDKLIASAQKNLEKGQIQKAIKDYQELLKLEPKSDQHRQKLADLMSRSNMAAEAIGHYEVLAKGYAEKGFYLKAIAVYKQIQKLDATKPDVYLQLAELNKKQGLTGNAMTEYRSLLELYEKKNQRLDAASVLQKMVELEPENLNLHIRVIQFLLKERLLSKAVESVAAAVEVFAKAGSSEKIAKIFDVALPKLAEDNDQLLGLAQTLSQKNAHREAIQVLNVLLKAAPNDANLLEKLADCYEADGDVANTRLTLSHLIKIEVTSERCERLIRLCVASGDAQRALHEIDVNKDVLFRSGRKEAVVGFLQELSNKFPENPKLKSALQALGAVPVAHPPQEPTVAATTVAVKPATTPPPAQIAKPAETPAKITPVPDNSTVPTEAATATVSSPNFDMAEEMSLDFLEGLVSPSVVEAPPALASDEILQAAAEDSDSTLSVETNDSAEIELDISLLDIEDDTAILDETIDQPEEFQTETSSAVSSTESDIQIILPALTVTDIDSDTQPAFASEEIEDQLPSINLSAEEEADVIEDELEIIEEDLEIVEDDLESIEELVECLEDAEVDNLTNEILVDNQVKDEIASIPNHRIVQPTDLLDELHELEDLSLDELDTNHHNNEQLISISDNTHFESHAADLDSLVLDEATDTVNLVSAATMPESLSTLNVEPEITADSCYDLAGLSHDDAMLHTVDELQLLDEETGATAEQLIHGELEELEFYLNQGLLDHAENVCHQILTLEPENSVASAKLHEIELLRQNANAVNADESDDFFDLASELLDDGAFQATAGLPNVVDDDRFRFDSVFTEFKKGIEAQIDSEDAEAHYNLGIAYKEMGLIDDAIGEFEKAMHDPARLADCLTLIGICSAEKGAFEEAEKVFLSAMQRDDLGEAGKMGICYELALIYEIWDKPDEALSCFEKVADYDIFFRNVGEKVDALRASGVVSADTTPQATVATPPPSPSSTKNRISFV